MVRKNFHDGGGVTHAHYDNDGDGTFDDKNVDTHQLLSYKKIMKNRKNTLTPGSSQPEVFNVLGQMQSIERIEEERKALGHEKKKAISETPKYGKQG